MKKLPNQATICGRFGSPYFPPEDDSRVGIALATLATAPLNALRLAPENGTCGWYIWGGEWSEDPNFFQPLHVFHLPAHAPAIIPYLALAPGWRVLLAPSHEDAWHDPALLAL